MRYCMLLAMAGLLALPGCLRVKVDPVEVKPITLNVNLKIDRELDDFFAFEEEIAPASPPVSAPAQSPAPISQTPAPLPQTPAPAPSPEPTIQTPSPTTPIPAPTIPDPAPTTPAPSPTPPSPAPTPKPGSGTIAVPDQFQETR